MLIAVVIVSFICISNIEDFGKQKKNESGKKTQKIIGKFIGSGHNFIIDSD